VKKPTFISRHAVSGWASRRKAGASPSTHLKGKRGECFAPLNGHIAHLRHTIAAMAATTPLITKTKCCAIQVRASRNMEPNRIHNARSTLTEGSQSGVGAVHVQQAHIVPQPTVSRQTHTRTRTHLLPPPPPTATTASME
jgi:hypothetical protein